jgi:Flp pilus assembly pilin Flp
MPGFHELGHFAKCEQGASMFEYAALVGVIALIAIGGAALRGGNLNAVFQYFGGVANGIQNGNPELSG